MMRQNFLLTAFFILLAGVGSIINAQSADVGIKANFAGGDVKAVEGGKIVLQTKDGEIDVVLSDKTAFKKVKPESPKITDAVDSALTDIGVGDKLLVTGTVAADKKSVPAKTVYLMTKSSIAEKQTKESQEWQTRGISGRVTNLNFEKNEVTLAVRNMTGETNVVVTPKSKVKFLRYAPDSIKYSEAKSSNMREIMIGDNIRALGEKSADGAAFQAEEIISGAFQTVGGKVKSIDAAKNEIVIEDLKTKKDITIAVGANSALKKFPLEMAQRMATRSSGENGGFRPPQSGNQTPQGNQNNPQSNPQNNQANPPSGSGQTPERAGMGGGRGGRGDINEIFERLPVIAVADLKAGDVIAVSSTKTDNPAKITAIRLLAGVEPFVNTPQGQTQGGRGRGGQDSNFTIPGLDGFSMP